MDIFFKYKNSKQLRFEGDDIFSEPRLSYRMMQNLYVDKLGKQRIKNDCIPNNKVKMIKLEPREQERKTTQLGTTKLYNLGK